jgi:hypothetical protein
MEPSKLNVAVDPQATGILPRYLDLIRSCRNLSISRLSALLDTMFDNMDDFMMQLAENAETNQLRGHYFEVMHEALLNQKNIAEIFVAEIGKGFDNFVAGNPEPLRAPVLPTERKLSLVDKDDYEVSLAYSEMVRKANEAYMPELLALNHRLAVLAGGTKLGECHPGLPGSPAQACDAMQTALEFLGSGIEPALRVEWAHEFDRRVIQQAADYFADYNRVLAAAGVLPNLSLEAIGFESLSTPAGIPRAAAPVPATPAPVPDEQPEATPEHALYEGIRQLLAERRGGPAAENLQPAQPASQAQATLTAAAAPAPQPTTDFAALMRSLHALQASTPSLSQAAFGHASLDEVKEDLARQSIILADLVQQQQISTADADIIDLVGMLFEFILNDKSLPDSVKALLGHLHTPILKVAMIDRKFFFRAKHPARRLLNALTQAGALCSGDGHDKQGIFAKMRGLVERIVQEFEDDTRLFAETLEEFTSFIDTLGHRSEVMEKRAVESAKGRERLREARQAVSKELVDITWNRELPKPVESLVTGPWANLMVLVFLRNGKASPEWADALKVVADLVWSVQPKPGAEERRRLRALVPELEERIRSGLALIGDPEVNAKALFGELNAVFKELLEAGGGAAETEASLPGFAGLPSNIELEVDPAPPEVQSDKAVWDDIDLPVSVGEIFSKHMPPELAAHAQMLKTVKLGTWFEFSVPEAKARIRAKLSWYSSATSYYIFVDQAGLQVAVKSMRALSHEMARGETRIVQLAKKPLMDRALEAVYSLLKQPGEEAAG